MKKTLTAVIFILSIALVAAFGMMSCNNANDKDNKPGESQNETKGETQPCEHVYDNACDTSCNECGEVRAITHDFEAADCLKAKTCKVCGITEGEALGHDYTSNGFDDHYHWVKCSRCDAVDDNTREKHVFNSEHYCEAGCKFLVVEKNEFEGGTLIELYNSQDKLIKDIFYVDGECLYYTDYYLNENGDLVKKEDYSGDGKLDDYTVYEYDENGNKIKTLRYSDDGELERYAVYEYDENNNNIKVAWYNGDGSLYSYDIYEYDANGNLIKEEWFDGEGVSEGYQTNEYDANGNKIKKIEAFADGEIYIYEYDANCNKIKEAYESPEGYKVIEEYDENGKEVKETYIDAAGEMSVEENTYDENGTLRKRIKKDYDAKGTLRITVENTYNENGWETESLLTEHYNNDLVIKDIMEYDESGNMIKSYEYQGGILIMTNVYEYDENGNEIKCIWISGNGEVVRTVINEYFDDGENKKKTSYYGESDVVEYEYIYYPDGDTKTYTYYDRDGEVVDFKEYDEDGNLISEI